MRLSPLGEIGPQPERDFRGKVSQRCARGCMNPDRRDFGTRRIGDKTQRVTRPQPRNLLRSFCEGDAVNRRSEPLGQGFG